jgi:hypothetical protein
MIINGIDIDTLPQTLAYNGDGTVNYIQVTVPGIPGAYDAAVYRQTFTYTSGKITGISTWVRQ